MGDEDKDKDKDKDKVPDSWKADLEESRKDRDTAKTQAREANEKLATIEAEREKEKTDKAEAKRIADEDKLKDEGKYKELFEKQDAENKTRLADKDKRYVDRVIPQEITAAAAELGNITPEAIKDLPELLRGKMGFDPDTLETFIKDSDGKPLKDDKMEKVTLKDYIEKFTSTRKYMLTDKQVQGSGANPPKHSSAERTMEKALKNDEMRLEWMKDDPDGYEKARAEYQNPKLMAARKREQLTKSG